MQCLTRRSTTLFKMRALSTPLLYLQTKCLFSLLVHVLDRVLLESTFTFQYLIVLIYSQDTCDLPQARIVFDVTLEGSARKLITVRSALLLHNLLELPVEVKLENTPTAHSRGTDLLQIFSSTSMNCSTRVINNDFISNRRLDVLANHTVRKM